MKRGDKFPSLEEITKSSKNKKGFFREGNLGKDDLKKQLIELNQDFELSE